MSKLIIGLVGTSGAGKSTVAKYLENKGFLKIELSSFLKEELQRRELKRINKKILQDLGNEFREKFGPEILVRRAIAKISKSKIKKAIIDGIRNLEEIAFLKKQDNFYLLGIDAKSRIRYDRIIKQRRDKWVGSYHNFLAIEKRDSYLGNDKIGLRVRECLKQAALIIVNNGSKELLYRELNKFIINLM